MWVEVSGMNLWSVVLSTQRLLIKS